MNDSIEMDSDVVGFQVNDLLEGYQYRITDYESFRRLTFHLFQGVLEVDVEIVADVVNLAEIITRHVQTKAQTLETA